MAAEHVAHEQASVTSDGNTGELTVRKGARLAVYLAIDAVSGTSPTLDVTLQEKVNGEWYDRKSFSQKTDSNANEQHSMGIPGPVQNPVRVAYVLGGTNPDFNIEIRVLEES